MEISGTVIRVAFLVLPGILGSKLYRKLRGRTRKKTWEDFTEILLFATCSYLLLGLVLRRSLGILDPLLDENKPIITTEVLWACVISFFVAFIAAYTHQYGLLNWLGYKLKATRRFGDEDLWTKFLADRRLVWCYVRDHKLNLVYYGCVRAYSESDEQRELILGQVTVYKNADGQLLYGAPRMYFSRDKSELTIELVPGEKT